MCVCVLSNARTLEHNDHYRGTMRPFAMEFCSGFDDGIGFDGSISTERIMVICGSFGANHFCQVR